MDAAILFAPVGALAFFELAARIPLRVRVQTYPLKEAQRALDDLRAGMVQGAAVLKP